jgi:maltose alpha-D-glucosyltransferase/alpha-amylase
VIRYGDEIGMGENLALKERDAVRTPMQWSSEENAGFSTAKRLVHPVIEDGIYGCKQVNVEAQRRDPQSLLNWMARMIRLRRECPEIGWGDWEVLRVNSTHVLVLSYAWRGNRLVILHNFDRHPHEVRLRVPGEEGNLLVNLLDENESRAHEDGMHRIALEERGYRWFRAGGLGYALKRTRDDAPAAR